MHVVLAAHEPFALECRELSYRPLSNHEIASAVWANAGPVNLKVASNEELSDQLLELNPVGWELFKIQHP
jgi:hypothetical protein